MVGTTLSVLPYAMAGSGLNPDGSLSSYGNYAWNTSGNMVNAIAPYSPMVTDLSQQSSGTFNLAQLSAPSLLQEATGYTPTYYAPSQPASGYLASTNYTGISSYPSTAPVSPSPQVTSYPSAAMLASLYMLSQNSVQTPVQPVSSAPVLSPQNELPIESSAQSAGSVPVISPEPEIIVLQQSSHTSASTPVEAERRENYGQLNNNGNHYGQLNRDLPGGRFDRDRQGGNLFRGNQ
jgi:hypothetical protein